MAQYAATTEVASTKSRMDIEHVLTRYGADSFAYMADRNRVQIGFEFRGMRIRFTLPLPDRNSAEFTRHSRGARTASAAESAYEQAVRQKWRALHLVVKAKLEAVESGISTFEQEFYANIVLPNGATVFENTSAQVSEMIATGNPGQLMLES